jgi:phytoene dehydrogenase-like protein
MTYDVIVAGAGMAGLTAAAYCVKSGLSVLVCEKQEYVGGHVNSFMRSGCLFDGGIRSLENSGVLFPMLKQLGIELEWVESRVSVGMKDTIISVDTHESLSAYQKLLESQFSEQHKNISLIIEQIRSIMGYMDILYGIDNPLFSPSLKDIRYIGGTILPWLVKYLRCMPKIAKLNIPVEEYLEKFTDDRQLIDIIAQHFFKATPAFFALSYFSLYLDYHYPKGGTKALPEALEAFILKGGGRIETHMPVMDVDVTHRSVSLKDGRNISYRKLIWACDQKSLYEILEKSRIADKRMLKRIRRRRELIDDKRGGDSVLTVNIAAELPRTYFAARSNPHLFYTPVRTGLSSMQHGSSEAVLNRVKGMPETEQRKVLTDWVQEFLDLTTFEISIPSLRDSSLSGEGRTGLVVSSLFSYDLVKYISDAGWYEEFKRLCEQKVLAILSDQLYPDLKDSVLECFSSTPLTIERMTGNTDGAITGWSFTHTPVPAVSSMSRIGSSVRTGIHHLYQAGQWTYSPSGLPISILTGKLAADKAVSAMRRDRA